MSFAQSLRATAIPVQTVAFGSVTSSFVAMGAAVPAALRVLKINNTTDSDIYISYDGVTQHDVAVAGSGFVVDITANKSVPEGLYLPEDTIVYIEYVSSAPTYGNIYLSAYYAATTY
jgi:hypothetical protein